MNALISSRLIRSFPPAAILLLATFFLPSLLLGAPEDEHVPEGVWFQLTSYREENQQNAIDLLQKDGEMKNYLLPNSGIRNEIDGKIARKVQRYNFLFTYGISDVWNVTLDIPYLNMEQSSTLSTSSEDTVVQAAVDRLQSQKISGIGAIHLILQQRTVFSDRNAFLFGYGLEMAGSGQQNPYEGSQTFDLAAPAPSIFTYFHYTRYPSITRSRYDIRAEMMIGMSGDVSTPSGNRNLDLGNRFRGKMAWRQEISGVNLGFESEYSLSTENTLSGNRISDKTVAWVYRVEMGYGNLQDLETGPVGFPFLVLLEIENLIRGYNIPHGSFINISLRTYF